MTSTMLVSIVLLVAGFGLILFFYSQLAFKGQVDREVCHQSVILRGTLPDTLGLKETAPLKCKTIKICVRGKKLLGKGECEEFTNADSVINTNVNDLTQIEKLISQEIVGCWSMMGEGKISLFSENAAEYGFGSVYPSCVICSRIAFDKESLVEKGIDIEERNVLNYMLTHKIPNGEKSYYGYLTGDSPAKISVKETISIPIIIEKEDGSVSSNESIEINLKDFSGEEREETQELAILYMQISAPTKWDSVLNIGSSLGFGAAGGAAVVGAAGRCSVAKWIGTGVKNVCKGPIAYACSALALIAVGFQQWSAEDNRGIAATYCGDVSTGEESRQGCSVVRTVNYNIEDIKKYCAVIESIP